MIIVINYSTIVGGDQQQSNGYLVLQTLPKHLHWDTWSLYSEGMQQRCFQSSNSTHFLAPQYGRMSGRPTTELPHYSGQLRPVTSENLFIFNRKYELIFMVSKVPVLHSWYLYESTIQVLSVDYLTNRNQLTN